MTVSPTAIRGLSDPFVRLSIVMDGAAPKYEEASLSVTVVVK